MSLRKTRLVPAEPKVGRYRLFDWLPKGWRRCRACGMRVRSDHLWPHHETELEKRYLDVLEELVRFRMRARRSRRNRAHAQYQYATKGEPWRRWLLLPPRWGE
jgi:hypothetical protein